jgi:hypothetical protein
MHGIPDRIYRILDRITGLNRIYWRNPIYLKKAPQKIKIPFIPLHPVIPSNIP